MIIVMVIYKTVLDDVGLMNVSFVCLKCLFYKCRGVTGCLGRVFNRNLKVLNFYNS